MCIIFLLNVTHLGTFSMCIIFLLNVTHLGTFSMCIIFLLNVTYIGTFSMCIIFSLNVTHLGNYNLIDLMENKSKRHKLIIDHSSTLLSIMGGATYFYCANTFVINALCTLI